MMFSKLVFGGRSLRRRIGRLAKIDHKSKNGPSAWSSSRTTWVFNISGVVKNGCESGNWLIWSTSNVKDTENISNKECHMLDDPSRLTSIVYLGVSDSFGSTVSSSSIQLSIMTRGPVSNMYFWNVPYSGTRKGRCESGSMPSEQPRRNLAMVGSKIALLAMHNESTFCLVV